MKELVRIRRDLKTMTEKGADETKKFARDILDLLEEMEKDSAASYCEGKAYGMETMARILFGSEE